MSPTKEDRLIRQMIEISKVVRNLIITVIFLLTLSAVGKVILLGF